MKILAIGAHPDDEIFMFGLLKLFKNRGDSVHLAVPQWFTWRSKRQK